MAELTVGSWNMLNSFGDARATSSLEVLKRMDADVVFLGEMTLRDNLDGEHYLGVADAMQGELGYNHSSVSNYSPYEGVRDMHTMSMWGRGAVQSVTKEVFGQRYGMKASIPDMDLTIFGVHLDDRSEAERVNSGKAILREWAGIGDELMILGDLNEMHRRDPKSYRLRALGRIAGRMEVADYYNENKKLQRTASRVLRLCRMAEGKTLGMLEDAGLQDADPYSPTISFGPIGFQLDHILASSGLIVRNFQRHPRNMQRGSPNLSDHAPITATIIR
jgi:endonuclease/exonuclease/phosphatase family metal-dependent hydrolase